VPVARDENGMTAPEGGTLDQRQRRTRAALHAALERIIERLPYAQITISHLAEEAGIGRPTFYRHYPTVDALLIDRVAKDNTEQRELAKRLADAGGDVTAALVTVTRFALERISARPKLYRALFDGSAGSNAVTLFREQLTDLLGHLPFPPNDLRNENLDLSVGMMSGAISGFLLVWMEAGFKPPAGDAARLLVRLLNLGRIETAR
jgi:AcrR family transcriptional regulator